MHFVVSIQICVAGPNCADSVFVPRLRLPLPAASSICPPLGFPARRSLHLPVHPSLSQENSIYACRFEVSLRPYPLPQHSAQNFLSLGGDLMQGHVTDSEN